MLRESLQDTLNYVERHNALSKDSDCFYTHSLYVYHLTESKIVNRIKVAQYREKPIKLANIAIC